MKKTAVVLLTVFSMSLLAGGTLWARSGHHYQTIKKSVKKNPDYQRGREVKYLKVSVWERGQDKVEMTIPILLVDLIMKHSRDLDIDLDHCHINMKKLWRRIKRLGPKSIIEIGNRNEKVKVWLE